MQSLISQGRGIFFPVELTTGFTDELQQSNSVEIEMTSKFHRSSFEPVNNQYNHRPGFSTELLDISAISLSPGGETLKHRKAKTLNWQKFSLTFELVFLSNESFQFSNQGVNWHC